MAEGNGEGGTLIDGHDPGKSLYATDVCQFDDGREMVGNATHQ